MSESLTDLLRRRLHHARLRESLPTALRDVSLDENERLRIVLADDVDAALLAPPPSAPSTAGTATMSECIVPPLSIAILVVGSRGDVQPFIPIARRLRSHGHRVRLATHGVFRQFVESHGVEFFPLGGDPKELMNYMVMTGGKIIPTSLHQIVEEVPRKRRMIAEILASTWTACTEPDPECPGAPPFLADAIIANPPSMGHLHVAEALHVPLHIMFTMPWTPTSAVPHPFAAERHDGRAGLRNWLSYLTFDLLTWLGIADLVNDFRRETLGLDALSVADRAASLVYDSNVPHTYLWSSALLAKPEDWSDVISITGFVSLDERDAYEPSPELAAFLAAGDPPVYIGFGSCPVPDPAATTQTICDAVAACGARAVLSRGWAGLGAGALPPFVLAIDDCPHDWIFPRCAAVCHHGGAGTIAAGLRAGRPTIVVPFFGDQHFWAGRLAEAGAAPPPIPFRTLEADALAQAIEHCRKPETRERAAALGTAIRAEVGEVAATESFHRHLPLAAMACAVDPCHLAQWFCDDCGLVLCAACEAAAHDGGPEADHRRYPYRYVDWAALRPELALPHLESLLSGAVAEIGHALGALERRLLRALRRGVALDDAAAAPSPDDDDRPLRRASAALAERLRQVRSTVDSATREHVRERIGQLRSAQGT